MPFLLTDIETVLDPVMPAYRPGDPNAFPPPPYWRVAIIGALWMDDDYRTRKLSCLPGEDEAAKVADWVSIVQERKPTVVTYGGRNFDVPVLTGAAMRSGLVFPHRFQQMSKRWDSRHVDVCDHLADFGACKSAGGLEAWALSLGWPGKLEGIHGNDVASLIAGAELAKAEAYCLIDVVMLAAVFLRLEQCRGRMSPTQYGEAVVSLVAAVEADPRLLDWSKLAQANEERIFAGVPDQEEPKESAA